MLRRHQLTEPGVEQHEDVVVHQLDGADFGYQLACIGDEKAPGLDLKSHRCPPMGGELPARVVPDRKVLWYVDGDVACGVFNWQSATGRNRLNRLRQGPRTVDHCPGNACQMRIIGTRADMHVQTDQ